MTTSANSTEKDTNPIPEDKSKQLEKAQDNTKETPNTLFTQTDSLKARIVLGFWSTIILLLPIWLYTTHQQRTPLNENEITDWFERKQYGFSIPLNIDIRWDKQLNSDKSFDSLNEEFSNFAKEYVLENQPRIVKNDSPLVNIIPNIKNSQFTLKFTNWKSFETNNPSSEFDGTLRYLINIIHESQIQEPLNWYPNEQAKYFALPLRQFAIVTKNKDNSIIKKQVESLVKAILGSSHNSMNPPVLNGNNERQGIKYVPHYQLTFSLMNEDIKDIQPNWDYQYIHNQFNKQLLHLLKNVSTFTVATQIHHISPLAVQPQTKKEGDVLTRYLTPTQLPQFVNSADWNIASAVLTEPDIHFLLYLPSSPLTIQHGNKEVSRSFSIPKWGGVYIAETPKSEEFTLTSEELEPVIKQFLKQFKELLDISNIRTTFDKYRLRVEQPYYTTLTGFEMDQYLLRRSMENIFDTASTLNSLITLVNKIKNMVILQKIQTDTQTCLNHLNEALKLLNEGKIQEGFQNTKQALTLAEKSFFDPSMVGLMYFPTEHKYAVYAPLFAPIVLTLVRVSIKTINKWRLARKTKTQ